MKLLPGKHKLAYINYRIFGVYVDNIFLLNAT